MTRNVVIGLDFGNSYTYPSFIEGMDEKRTGGHPERLLDPALSQVGIPSRFYFEEGMKEPYVGMELSYHNIPETAGKNLLKRHLGETFSMGGKTFEYDEAVRRVAEHAIREANEYLEEMTFEPTNLVSLAYPVTFSSAQRKRLVEIIESATLKNGTKVRVVGTIKEPAAAALQVLSEKFQSRNDATVLVYDLGGGTFDATILSLYPEGRKNINGELYYYEEHLADGLEDLGGEDFTRIIKELIEDRIRKARMTPPSNQLYRDSLSSEAQEVKHVLSKTDKCIPNIQAVSKRLSPITREEFERKSEPLIKRTVDVVAKMLRESDVKPECIILTGGASNMPMVKNTLVDSLASYGFMPDDFKLYLPNYAVTYGAARYGVVEIDDGQQTANEKDSMNEELSVRPVLIQRLQRDIGIRFYRDYSNRLFIDKVFERGAEIPNTYTEFREALPRKEGSEGISLQVYEARLGIENPSVDAWERDWEKIGEMDIDFGRPVASGFISYYRLVIDKDGILRMEAYTEDGKEKTFVHKDLTWIFRENE